MAMPAGTREIELLARFIDADGARPGDLFVAVYMNQGTVVRHSGLTADDGLVDEAALLGLDGARLLLVNTRDDRGRPKSFYLPSNSRQELEDLRASAERAARQAAEKAKAQAAAGPAPLSLAEMLATMIEAQKARPGQFFTRYDTYPNQSLGHPAWDRPKPIEHTELARLLHSGAVVQPDPTSGALLHLEPIAGDVLAAELRLLGDGPLAEAEAREARNAARRRDYARKAGTRRRRLVMAILMTIIIGLAILSVLADALAPAVVAVILVVYEVVTDGLGYSAASLAHRAGERRENAVLEELEG